MRVYKTVWVELRCDDPDGFPYVVRIFKNQKAAYASGLRTARTVYETAVKDIRAQLWKRCGGFCELCGDLVTEKSGHMHEQKWRGKGGEISLENSVFICAKTHKLEHNERNPQFTRRKSWKT